MLPSCMSQDIKKKVFTTESFTGLNFDEKQTKYIYSQEKKKIFWPQERKYFYTVWILKPPTQWHNAHRICDCNKTKNDSSSF